jgi:hypothetical protein
MNLLTHFRKITILRFVLAGLVLLFSVPALFGDGIASRYPNDVGIENDPAVILADGFETYTDPIQIKGKWDQAGKVPNLRLATEPGNFVRGRKALEMKLPISSSEVGTSITKKVVGEPVVFVRTYAKWDLGFNATGHNGIRISGDYPGPGNGAAARWVWILPLSLAESQIKPWRRESARLRARLRVLALSTNWFWRSLVFGWMGGTVFQIVREYGGMAVPSDTISRFQNHAELATDRRALVLLRVYGKA